MLPIPGKKKQPQDAQKDTQSSLPGNSINNDPDANNLRGQQRHQADSGQGEAVGSAYSKAISLEAFWAASPVEFAEWRRWALYLPQVEGFDVAFDAHN